MAYNLKYRGTYKDSTGVVKEIRLSFEEYAGVVTELYTGETPADYSMDLGDGVISGNPVGSTRFQFTLFFETLIDIREFMYTRRECLCEVYNRDTDKIEFQGWVEPYNGGRPNSKPPHIITLTASCGLAQLQKIRYKPDGGTRIRTLFDIIQDCLKLTGLQLPFVSNFLTRETAMTTTDALKGVKLNTDRFIGNDKKMAYASEVLTSVLQVTNCEMFQTQHSGEAIWLLRSVPNQVRGYNHAYAYDKTGNYLYPTLIDNGFNINSTSANTLDVGAISALEAIQRHKVSVQLVGGVPGVIPNGDLLLWDGSTFAHWDMSTMAGNWNWFDTQDEFYPNGIQLNGSMGYSDLVEEYTTGWWIFKKKYTRAVEPARYIEVGPGDITGMENIVLEGEYETSLNVEYVLMQIRMVKADDTTEMFWNAETNDWQDTVYYMGLPAATAGRVESGVKKSRGKIEINLGITQSKYLVPFTKLYVRFYQVYRLNPKNPPSPPSGGYFLKLYGLWSKGSKQREITNYSVTLEVKDGVFENEEDEVIVLSGDFMTDVKGAFLREDGLTPTTSWSRRDIEESVSIYRTMLSDRLNMTWKMLRTYDGEIQEFSPIRITPQMLLTFLDTGITAKITRMTYDDRKRILKSFSGVEVQWSEPDNGVTMYTEISYNSEDIRDSRTQGPRRPGSGEVYTDNDADGGQLVAPPDGSSGGERFRIGEEPGDNNYEDILQDWSFNHSLKFFTELPPLIFFHLQPGSREIDLAEYFVPQYWESDHNPDDFNLELFDAPAWVGTVTFNGLKVTVTGTPPEEAQYFVRAYIIDPEPEINIKSSVWIPITVLPYATAKFTLKDETNSPAGQLIPGKPNSYLYTNPWGVIAAVDGQHDAIGWELRGGGGTVNINSGPTPVPVSGTVHNILTDVTYAAGIYDLVFRTYRDIDGELLENYSTVVIFNLFDPDFVEDPEHRVKLDLLDVTSDELLLGEITNIETVYEGVEFWDIEGQVTGIIHDQRTLSIFPEITPFINESTPTITDITGTTTAGEIFTSNGTGSFTPGYLKTDFIPVEPGDCIWYFGTTTNTTGVAGYSDNDILSFVTGLLNSGGLGELAQVKEIIIPSGVFYIRASSKSASISIKKAEDLAFRLFDTQVIKEPGLYSVFVRLWHEGTQVYEKFGQYYFKDKTDIVIGDDKSTIELRYNSKGAIVDANPLSIDFSDSKSVILGGTGKVIEKVEFDGQGRIVNIEEGSLPATTGFVSLSNTTGSGNVNAGVLSANAVIKTSVILSSGWTETPTQGAILSLISASGNSGAQLLINHAANDTFYWRALSGSGGAWYRGASREHVEATYVPLTRTVSAGAGLTGGGALSSNTTISLAVSGVTAGTYKSVTVDTYGRVTAGSNPTTLAGFGIIDAFTKTESDARYLQGSSAAYVSLNNSTGLANPNAGALSANAITKTSFQLSGSWSDAPITAGFLITGISASSGSFGQLLFSHTVDDSAYFRKGNSSGGDWFQISSRAWSNNTFVPITRTVAAGAGLSGGGALSGNITLSLATSGVGGGTYRSVTVDTYGRVTAGSNPTTLAAYGITDVYTKTESDGRYIQTVTAGMVTSALGFTPAWQGRNISGINSIVGGGTIDIDRTFQLAGDHPSPGNSKYYGTNGSGTKGWFDLPSTSGTITGSGTTNYIPRFSSSTALANSIISQSSTEITVTGSLITTAHTSFRGLYNNFYRDIVVGDTVADVHGRIGIHDGTGSGMTFAASAALQIDSTTKVVLLPRLNGTQILAVGSPQEGMIAMNMTAGGMCQGFFFYGNGAWRPIYESI